MGIARRFTFLFFCSILFSASAFAQADLSGTVVDESGSALPRVAVRLVDARGADVAVTFTDSRGAFHFARACDACAAVVSLPGFNATRAALAGGTPVRLTLTVAPVQESVVVSATRNETPTSQVGAAVTVFTAEEIERRDTPLIGELLRATPGVTVVRSGGLGNVTSLFVRGGESSYNKVLLDGIPLNEPGGTFNFSNLTTDFVERVEVVRGAQSALFGTDAMASVVQVVSKRAPRGLSHPSVMIVRRSGIVRLAARIRVRRGGAGHVGCGDSRRQAAHRQSRAEQHVRQHDHRRQRRRHAVGQRVAAPRRARRVRAHGRAWRHRVRPARHGRVLPSPRRRDWRDARQPDLGSLAAARHLRAERVASAVDKPADRSALRAALRRPRRAICLQRFSRTTASPISAAITRATRRMSVSARRHRANSC